MKVWVVLWHGAFEYYGECSAVRVFDSEEKARVFSQDSPYLEIIGEDII